MPKLVKQIGQGNTYGLNAEANNGAWTATRSWKIILNAVDEDIDISAAIGVSIGDAYSESNPIPCVSIEGRADGDSRLVRIVTATYRASPSGTTDPSGEDDPKTLSPLARPATYSMSTSLAEIAAWGGRKVTGGVSGAWLPATNAVGDIIDGVVRLEPILNITFEQYSATDQSQLAQYTGYVNEFQFNFSSYTILPHCCMFQGFSSASVVEQFGQLTFRGFKVSLTFSARTHFALTRDGAQPIGWDMAVPQTGLNIINSGLGDGSVDQNALVLQHEEGKVKQPASLADGTSGKKVRAMVTVASPEGGSMQRPASQPVALNDNGTPRINGATPPVWINRVCLQPEMDFGENFSAFGVRL